MTHVDERQARKVAEEAREQTWRKPSFGKELFLGRLPARPHPPAPGAHRRGPRAGRGIPAPRCSSSRRRTSTARCIEREARIPDEIIKGLADARRVRDEDRREYGGLGLSQLYYNRALIIAGSAIARGRRAAVRAPVDRRAAAGEAVRHRGAEAGVPAPLRARRDQRVPAHRAGRRLGPGPAAHHRHPERGRQGVHARRRQAVDHQRGHRRPAGRDGAGAQERRATAAASPRSWWRRDADGITVENRNAFMGLRGLENGVTRFHQVRVPAENRVGERGPGPQDRPDHAEHRPALAAGHVRGGGEVVAQDRPGMVAANASSGAGRSASTRRWRRRSRSSPPPRYALEAMVDLSSQLADDDRNDIRIEAASPSCSARRWATGSPTSWCRSAAAAATRRPRRWRPAASAAVPGRAGAARPADQPDLRGLVRDHAAAHRPRGGGRAPVGRR